MWDIDGVIAVLGAYPVHIMSFVGTIMLVALVIPKRRRWRNLFSNATEPHTEKRKLTQSEKETLSQKIQSAHTKKLKKSFAGKDARWSMALTLLGLFVAILLWILIVTY